MTATETWEYVVRWAGQFHGRSLEMISQAKKEPGPLGVLDDLPKLAVIDEIERGRVPVFSFGFLVMMMQLALQQGRSLEWLFGIAEAGASGRGPAVKTGAAGACDDRPDARIIIEVRVEPGTCVAEASTPKDGPPARSSVGVLASATHVPGQEVPA